MCRTPWADLELRTLHKRSIFAVKRLQDDFLPFVQEALNMHDEHGKLIDNNASFWVVLEYGAMRANTQNRLAGVTFPECLPEEVVDAFKEAGRAELVAEQRQEFRVENMDEWILVNKLLTTQDAWNAVRKLVPSHVMPPLSEVTREAASQMLQYCHRVRWMRTHSGEHIHLREFLPLLILSNLITFCAGPTSRLSDQVYILIKLMIDGCHVQYVHCRNLVLAHLNVGLLPLDRTVMMTYLYPTDEEQRANNPAGIRGSCCATVALYVGDESWAGLRANFTDGNDADGQFNLLNLERDIRQGKVVVDKLKHLCRLFCASMTTTGGKEANKSELERKLLDYIELNRTLLESRWYN